MIDVSDGSAFIAIILIKKRAYSETTCGSSNSVQLGKISNFFQWNEFGPSAGLTAGLGSVRVMSIYAKTLSLEKIYDVPRSSKKYRDT